MQDVENKIPDDMEEWLCCNDPSIDSILRGTLMPKGSQDKYRKMMIKVRKERAEYLVSMQEIWRKESEEYDREMQQEYMNDSSDSSLKNIKDSSENSFENDFEGSIESDFDDTFNEVTDIKDDSINEEINKDIDEDIQQSEVIQLEELSKQQINVDQINKDIGKPDLNIFETVSKKNDGINVVKDIKHNTNLKINPDLSATKNFIRLLKQAEPLLTSTQKLQFLDKSFVTKNLGLSLDLLKPYSNDDSVRFINGHSRYIRQPIIFNDKKWFLTNNIYKSNVEKLITILNSFIERSDNIEDSSNG